MLLNIIFAMLASRSDGTAMTLHVAEPSHRAASLPLSWNVSPSGESIGADEQSLLLDGQRVCWSMGEFHYARYPEQEWRRELLKMKAGGIDVVSSYVFWIHHEEIEGKWDWSGRRNLRHFVTLCKELGLKFFLRGGPWVHGECRNGGFPDWLVKRYHTRTMDAGYLAHVGELYSQISKQIAGLSWAEGGPVIGFQLENEYGGPAEYIVKLKQMAIGAGIHVPIYTRTGWPAMRTPATGGEIFPMFGGYPVGFWDRGTEETAPRYGNQYLMTLLRNPDLILQGKPTVGSGSPLPDPVTPYMCCEIGGGIADSYHRRLDVTADDIGSLAMVKLASGSNLQGYYMYHGGTNPDGVLTTFNETQATGYWNDLPVKTYDYQAPLGEAGQIHDQYHILRRMHLFMHDFGVKLAGMPAELPDRTPVSPAEDSVLRWSVRTAGGSGVLFVNNYQRLKEMPEKTSCRFNIDLPTGEMQIPNEPVDVPKDCYFFWPFHWDLSGIALRYATAQPICILSSRNSTAYFFAEVPSVRAEFAFANSEPQVAKVGRLEPAFTLTAAKGRLVKIFVLSDRQSLRLWRGVLGDAEHVVLADGGLFFDRGKLVIDSSTHGAIAVYPPVSGLVLSGHPLPRRLDGSFSTFAVPAAISSSLELAPCKSAEFGTLRKIGMGSQGVAEQPSDLDFATAAVWDIPLPSAVGKMLRPTLSIDYAGDVARLFCNGKLISDNFYDGRQYVVPLSKGMAVGHLALRVLPLQRGAPIYFPPAVKPVFDHSGVACALKSASIRDDTDRVLTVGR